jgi:hypothetical protein
MKGGDSMNNNIINIIRNTSRHLENQLRETPQMSFGVIEACGTLYTQYKEKQKREHGYDDIRDIIENDNVIDVRWLEVHTSSGTFIVKATPGYDNLPENWVCYTETDQTAEEYDSMGDVSPYYFWTLTIPEIPDQHIKKLIEVTLFELVNETFVLYDMENWNEIPIPVFAKIKIRSN